MRIAINALGTRGDIQPYVALGIGLKRAGHEVRLVTHAIFRELVNQHGLTLYSLDLDPREVLLTESLSQLGNNPIRVNQWIEHRFAPVLGSVFEATFQAARDAELMVNSGLSIAGWHVAEKLGIPAVAAYLWPATPSRYMPGATGQIPPPWIPFKGLFNYLSTKLSNQLFFRLLSPLVNRCRDQVLGLRPLTLRDYWSLDSPASQAPLVYGFSSAVVPKPPDWGPNQQIAGYWFLDADEGYVPDPALAQFLQAGEPPVCVGFGSMVEQDRRAMPQLVADALAAVGQRGILLSGWSEFGAELLTDSVFAIDAVPHDWLFPRVRAVVHHGGAGTTAAALRDGLPSVIVPSFADQFFWGWRVHDLGAAAAPILRVNLTDKRLAEAIGQVVHDESVRRQASLLGRQIRDEDGVVRATALIDEFAHRGYF
jgi:UDP:flavonoid glycosyltransferase YjiC (YdhE family)